MSIHDKACDGSLKPDELQKYLDTNKSTGVINQPGGTQQVTLLAAACLSGRLDLVKLLMNDKNKADPDARSSDERTPLFFATCADFIISPPVRRSIVHALIVNNAHVDLPCDEYKNTALMNVMIQLQDEKIVQELLEGHADPTLKHDPNQKTAKELADENGLSRYLLSKADRASAWKKMIDVVVSFVLLIIVYANNKAVNRAVGGIAKIYHIRVNEAEIPKTLRDEVQPKTVGEFKNFLSDHVQQGTFGNFFSSRNDPFLQNLAAKASELSKDDTTDLSKPENIKRLTQVSLYRPVIYCDDSGSMKKENRYESQVELVTRIARITTIIVPETDAFVDLRFINNGFSSRLTADKVEKAMRDVTPQGYTNIGTNLREKILKPLVYDVISKTTTSGSIPFDRPLLVCVITDGSPYPEAPNLFRDTIVECKKELEKNGYEETAVMFCINQIGTSEDATEFLEGLRKEEDIKNVIYCTVDQLDVTFKELKENERKLESKLLEIVSRSVLERHPEGA